MIIPNNGTGTAGQVTINMTVLSTFEGGEFVDVYRNGNLVADNLPVVNGAVQFIETLAAGTYIYTAKCNDSYAKTSQPYTVVLTAPPSPTPPPVVAVTWNPADKFADIVLTNNNLTATQIMGGNMGTVRCTLGRTTGRWVFELRQNSDYFTFMGIASQHMSMGSFVTQPYSWGVQASIGQGGYTEPPGLAFLSPAVPDNQWLMFAVDIDARKLWLITDGQNVNSGDPAGGNNPIATWPLNAEWTTIFPAASVGSNPEFRVDANFGATAFANPIPTGFAAWQSSQPPQGIPKLLVVKKILPDSYPPINGTGVFEFTALEGGGNVDYEGFIPFQGGGGQHWGPQRLFDNIQTVYDWANSAIPDGDELRGIWTFPKEVTVTDIFVIPRATGYTEQFPINMQVVVDGVKSLSVQPLQDGTRLPTPSTYYFPTTLTEGVSGHTIPYSGPGFKISPNLTGTSWALVFNQGQVNAGGITVGEIEFWGYSSTPSPTPGPTPGPTPSPTPAPTPLSYPLNFTVLQAGKNIGPATGTRVGLWVNNSITGNSGNIPAGSVIGVDIQGHPVYTTLSYDTDANGAFSAFTTAFNNDTWAATSGWRVEGAVYPTHQGSLYGPVGVATTDVVHYGSGVGQMYSNIVSIGGPAVTTAVPYIVKYYMQIYKVVGNVPVNLDLKTGDKFTVWINYPSYEASYTAVAGDTYSSVRDQLITIINALQPYMVASASGSDLVLTATYPGASWNGHTWATFNTTI